MSFKRLTPDPAENLQAARIAAEEITVMSKDLVPKLHAIRDNLLICSARSLKAEKLDYCIRRLDEIIRTVNSLELGSFCGIAVKNTCQELWQKLP